MNFLLRASQTTSFIQSPPPISDFRTDPPHSLKPESTSKFEQALVEEPPRPCHPIKDNSEEDSGQEDNTTYANAEDGSIAHGGFKDVPEDQGWITIPQKHLSDFSAVLNITSLCSIDRCFVFPGEQLHIIACLSASQHDSGIITPFKVADAIHKNTQGQSKKSDADIFDPQASDEDAEHYFETLSETESDTLKGTSLPQMEDHKTQTENLLHKFNNSHFFVRISESWEPLWSKRTTETAGEDSQEAITTGTSIDCKVRTTMSAIVDRGNLDSYCLGGLARTVKCCSFSNGDIMVILQVNVGIGFLKDPVIEILQFERCIDTNYSNGNSESLTSPSEDPCEELLKWLLPLDNSIPHPAPPFALPAGSNSSAIIASQRSNFSASSSSQIFSFGHFRSYSMSSLPPSAPPSHSHATMANSKTNFDIENWDHFPTQPFVKAHTGNDGLMSFRGIPLEPERFSVRCGLSGIYLPGRRWRKKIEIIEPVEVNSFSAECNADDLLCVQIKNISPEHIPDLVVFVDAITIVYENGGRDGPPDALPIACVDAGEGYSFPNLALRRGEEHSFILKPITSMWKNVKSQARTSHLLNQHPPKITAQNESSINDQYAVLVSYRSNLTESRLLVKKPTNWRPRSSRDLMISVTSEMSTESQGASKGDSQLPVQVVTLQASNLTSDDLTLTILAPALFTTPSLVPLESSQATLVGPCSGGDSFSSVNSALPNPGTRNPESEAKSSTDAVFPNTFPNPSPRCTHLWLQSRVPLGVVSSRSMTKVKLELLPLTNGIITLDTLQIYVKEKGVMYFPEQCLKINATSSISTTTLV